MVYTIRVWYIPYAYGIKYAYGIEQPYYRGLVMINCNLYGGMNYLFNLELNLYSCVSISISNSSYCDT